MAKATDTLGPIKEAIKEAKAQLKDATPTPPVGTIVIWYRQAKVAEDAQIAALVTKIDGVGKLTLTVFTPFGMPEHKRGCLHISDPIHQQRNNSVSVNSGCWDYPKGQEAEETHLAMHKAKLAIKIDSLEKQLAEAEDMVNPKKESPEPSKTVAPTN